jgi:RNA 2',3'-cyclic 3'-phosphodiesterase
LRLFVAAEPSDPVRRAAADAAGALRRALESKGAAQGLRWVPEENLHLTVWFLGEVSDARAVAVLDALTPPLASPSFTLHLAGLGAFPPSGPPRVLWMGVREGLREMSQAHDEVGARLAPWGFAPEGRAYSAHLTIARVKEPPAPPARTLIRQLLKDTTADAGSCRIDALTVFRSRTAPGGAVYEPVLRVPLS